MKALTNVIEGSEPEESKGEDPSAILNLELGMEESMQELQLRQTLFHKYKTCSNSNYSILSKH